MADNDKTVGRLKALRDSLIQSSPPVTHVLAGLPVTSWEFPPEVKAILDAIQAALDCVAVNDAAGAVAHTVEVFDRLTARQAENHRQMLADTHQLDYRLYAPGYWKSQNQIDGTREAIAASEPLKEKILAEFDRQLRLGNGIEYSQTQAARKYHVSTASVFRYRKERAEKESVKPV